MAYNGLTNFMLVYNICRSYTADKKRKWMYVFMSIVGMGATVFIQQTRAYVISFLLIIILLVLFKSEKTIIQKLLVLLLIGLGIVLLSTGAVNNFLNSFTEGEEVQSTLVRTGAFLYFWETFKENPLWGHGFLTAAANSGIKQGPLGYYYYADTGIVGFMAQMGVFGVISIVWPIVHWTRVCWKNRNKGLDVFLPLSIVFCISIMPTLLCTTPAQVMMWPVYFAIFAYLESENDLDSEEQSLLVV
jgi:O-antigen ligase